MRFLIAGMMKTYWLDAREDRIPLRRSLSANPERIEAHPEPSPMPLTEDRRVYSPVTFQEIARRSIGSSPAKGASARGKSMV